MYKISNLIIFDVCNFNLYLIFESLKKLENINYYLLNILRVNYI